jgi:hypothetical protein
MNAIPLLRSGVAAVGVALAAQSPPPFVAAGEDLLPASTWSALRFGGLAACRGATQGHPLQPLVAACLGRLPDELRQQFGDGQLDRGAEEVQRQLQRLGLRPSDLRALLGQPMVLAVGRPTV